MSPEPRPCNTHTDLFNFGHALPHLTESLKKQRKIKIVAIGSSSTAGEIHVELIRQDSRYCCGTVSTTA